MTLFCSVCNSLSCDSVRCEEWQLSNVLLYHRKGCPFAAHLRLRMKLAGIEYQAIRFDKDPAGAALVEANTPDGNQISPTVRVGEQFLPNPSIGTLREVLSR